MKMKVYGYVGQAWVIGGLAEESPAPATHAIGLCTTNAGLSRVITRFFEEFTRSEGVEPGVIHRVNPDGMTVFYRTSGEIRFCRVRIAVDDVALHYNNWPEDAKAAVRKFTGRPLAEDANLQHWPMVVVTWYIPKGELAPIVNVYGPFYDRKIANRIKKKFIDEGNKDPRFQEGRVRIWVRTVIPTDSKGENVEDASKGA